MTPDTHDTFTYATWSITSAERSFSYSSYSYYHDKYWRSIFGVLAIYFLGIHVGGNWMRNRTRFTLRSQLFWWNFSLAIFSILGAVRTVPELVWTLRNRGLYHAICVPPNLNGFYGVWLVFFIHSKLVELGDTAFIILRKQKLIFLHWYHHMTVLFCVYFTTTLPLSTVRWYLTTNYTVHAIMYTYYAMKARGIRVPKFIAATITILQLTQMVIAFYVTVYAWVQKVMGNSCELDWRNIGLAVVCYASYFVLFALFFQQAYMTQQHPQVVKKPSIEVDANKNSIKVD